MTDEPFESTFLRFVQAPPKPKTKVWWVVQRQRNIHLGWVGWWASWRRYAFYPKADTIFEETCLQDIARFCIEQTKAHRAARK